MNYKGQVESKLQEYDTKGLWKGLKWTTGYGSASSILQEGSFRSDEANQFFA